MRPVLTQPEIRRDTVRVLRAIRTEPNLLVEAAERLPKFEGPALVVWAAGDRVMRPSAAGASPHCSRRDGWSRSTTATRSSPGPTGPARCAHSRIRVGRLTSGSIVLNSGADDVLR